MTFAMYHNVYRFLVEECSTTTMPKCTIFYDNFFAQAKNLD